VVGASCGTPPSETSVQDLGKSCLPSAEASATFGGFVETDVTLDHDAGCIDTCLISNFRGRVSCPYGQADPATGMVGGVNATCFLPMKTAAPDNMVQVKVEPQLASRRPEQTVYCSCHCGAPPLCTCSPGFACTPQLSGESYCVKDGTQVPDPSALASGAPCVPGACGVVHPFGL